MDDKFLSKRFSELAERAYATGRYTYSDFLGLGETDVLMRMKGTLAFAGLTLWGGVEGCERRVARFGDAEALGYEEIFPIDCIEAAPRSQKFADRLTHRDLLGALMNLGIERDLIGDIYLRDNTAYFFCLSRLSRLLAADLTRAKRTALSCRVISGLPEGVGCECAEERVQVASERVDVLVAAAYRLTREESLALFLQAKVFIDGRQCANNSETLKPGAVVSVRGHGRFRYLGYDSLSKKGKLNARVARWV